MKKDIIDAALMLVADAAFCILILITVLFQSFFLLVVVLIMFGCYVVYDNRYLIMEVNDVKAADIRELRLTLSTGETDAFKAILNSVNDSGLNEEEKKVFDEMYTEVSNFLSRR